MKMNKKMFALILAGMLSIPMFGCDNSEVEYQEPQTNQEEIRPDDNTNSDIDERNNYVPADKDETIDEDLNEEYKQEMNKEEQLQQAKSLIEKIAANSLTDFRWDVYVDEESNTVMLRVHATATDCAIALQDGSYTELTNSMTENSKEGKKALEQLGLDVNYSVMLMDLDTEMVYFGAVNGTVLYDASK